MSPAKRSVARAGPHVSEWLTPSTLLTLAGIAAAAIVWYATAQTQLSAHEKAIELLLNTTKREADARAHVRDEFLARSEKTNESLAKLNEQIAVSNTKYEMMITTLNKIAESTGAHARPNR